MTFGTPGARVQSGTSALAAGAWLDGPVKNWNNEPLVTPHAPGDLRELCASQCTKQIRKARSREDREVTKAGWALVAPAKARGDTVIVLGMQNADGMCRPLQYQYFVFVRGKFAGTLSPRPMDSRSDGAINLVEPVSSSHIHVQYSRYKDSDPLCCPSRLSTIEFTLQLEKSGSIIVAGTPQTAATSAGQ
jgi:hypothetical protein